VVITATAEDLCLEFEHDQATAGAKYKGATVEVEGLVAVAAEGLGGGAVVALLGPAKIRADEGWIALPENAVSGVDRSGETTWTFTDPVTGERVVATQREIRIGDCIVALVFPAEEAQDLAELAPGTNDFRARCSWAEYGYFAPLQARVVRLVGCKHQL
jgi:hypothetical protein